MTQRSSPATGSATTGRSRGRRSSRELWDAAIDALPSDLAKQIDFSQDEKSHPVYELIEITEEARQSSDNKSWSFKRHGKTVIVRHILLKVSKWANHFKEIGDTIVTYDPTHAALPWAGVRFLLQAALGDLTTYSSLLENIPSVSESICRNALVEGMLKGSSNSAAEELSRAIISLYTSILEYLAKAIEFYRQNTLNRMLRYGVLSSTDLEASYANINAMQENVDRCCTVFGLQRHIETNDEIKNLFQRLDSSISRWDERLSAINDHLNRDDRSNILQWISSEPNLQHHRQAHSEILQGTGTWLFHDSKFLEWKNETASSILWLHGIPGSGKSKLLSMVVEDAYQAFTQKQAPAPVFFYCSRNPAEPGRSDPATIMASLLKQLSRPEVGGPILQPVIDEYNKRKKDGSISMPLTRTESANLMLKLLETYKSTTLTIAIDALDECDTETRLDLLDEIEKLLRNSPCLLKIFVSSRDDQNLVNRLEHYPTLQLSSQKNSKDINRFLQTETARLIGQGRLFSSSNSKQALQKEIVEVLSLKASGMFRWASLSIQALCDQHTDDAVHERVGRLPRTLAGLYQDILSAINCHEAEADRRYTRRALSLLLCGQERLSSKEFLAAVSGHGTTSSISHKQLLSLCNNLVVFDSELDAFRFSHLSVREFLEDPEVFGVAPAHAIVAELCLRHLAQALRPTQSELIFTRYAGRYWGIHTKQGLAENPPDALKSALGEFFQGEGDPTSPFSLWADWQDPRRGRNGLIQKKGVCSIDLALCGFFFEAIAGFAYSSEVEGIMQPYQYCLGILGLTQLFLPILLSPFLPTHFVLSSPIGPYWSVNTIACDFVLQYFVDDALQTSLVIFLITAHLCVFKGIHCLLMCHADWSFFLPTMLGMAIRMDLGQPKGSHSWSFDLFLSKVIWIAMPYLLAFVSAGLCIAARTPVVPRSNSALLTVCAYDLSGILTVEYWNALCHGRTRNSQSTYERTVVACGSCDVLQWCFDQNIPFRITTSLMEVAARSGSDAREMLPLLLKRHGKAVRVTEEVVVAAVGNEECGDELMASLFKERDKEIRMSARIVDAAIRNIRRGHDILALVLAKREQDTGITQNHLVKAAKKVPFHGPELMALLLDKKGEEVQITRDVVEAAVMNRWGPRTTMTLLAQKRGDEVVGIVKEIMTGPYNLREMMSIRGLSEVARMDLVEVMGETPRWVFFLNCLVGGLWLSVTSSISVLKFLLTVSILLLVSTVLRTPFMVVPKLLQLRQRLRNLEMTNETEIRLAMMNDKKWEELPTSQRLGHFQIAWLVVKRLVRKP
ncbi:hypothetical protein B0T10DRAFT_573510 [Thelonectria olida]|uniref:NACHT domain-containing protein n=1 Tax=Thelonectria olida TaxID=1576542 RepID=A0A9P8W5N1_9HYPO|nr:hypothetical protein B0T10DRAFT_573510 [Thelonectria olida]